MSICQLIDEDGNCPNGMDPAWCGRCSVAAIARAEAEKAAAVVQSRSEFYAIFPGLCVTGRHMFEENTLIARRADGDYDCSAHWRMKNCEH